MAEDTETAPRHVAIIMDGNGRWAERRGLSRIEGHREGLCLQVHQVEHVDVSCIPKNCRQAI